MEFKKCARCGCFFVSDSDVCLKCQTRDIQDINKLNSCIDNSININSITELSASTGVSLNNINRFIEDKKFKLL